MLTITIIIPAHNEAGSIRATLDSITRQTRHPNEVIVVDDASTDGTAEIVREYGHLVLKPGRCGSKAASQNAALFHEKKGKYLIQSDVVLTIDADTSLDPHAIEEMMKPFEEDDTLVAACGTVIPANLDNPFTLGRLGEYLFTYALGKPMQQAYGGVYIVSGCFGAYRTKQLREVGGWQTRTLTEDMDLTATLHAKGYKLGYVAKAICHPIEPYNARTMAIQLDRWSAGFFQNITLHMRDYSRARAGIFVAVSLMDAFLGGAWLFLLPVLLWALGPEKVALGYFFGDLLPISIAVLFMGQKVGLLKEAVLSIPCLYLTRSMNAYFWFKRLIQEWILRKHASEYVKGH